MFTADRSSLRFRAPLRAAAASALVVSSLLLAGCGGGGDDGKATAAPSPSAPADDFGCLSPEQAKAGSVTFRSADGQDVGAFATGTGDTALVLAHQADGDVCQWVPKALDLAEDGYRVVGGSNHGVGMLADPANYALVEAFLKKYGG